MSNDEYFGCGSGKLLSMWNLYKELVAEGFPDYTDCAAVTNPFEWLNKEEDAGMCQEFEPGRLVVDEEGRYGIVLERRGHIFNNNPRIDCLLVDFKGTAGKVNADVSKLTPAKFPKELVDFVRSDNGDLKDKVHKKVEEAFNG